LKRNRKNLERVRGEDMKKLLVFMAIFLALSGCANKNELNNTANDESFNLLENQISGLTEELTLVKALVMAAEDKIAGLEKQISDLPEGLLAPEDELDSTVSVGFTDPATYNQNKVVENPQKNRVTFDIDEKLIGKYAVEDDPDMYFEISPDGQAKISLNALEGYAKYSSVHIQLTAYYSGTSVFINFNLVSGKWTYPDSSGLSVTFEGDTDCTSFLLTTYLPDERLIFVKQ
jgi:hypothetical protein